MVIMFELEELAITDHISLTRGKKHRFPQVCNALILFSTESIHLLGKKIQKSIFHCSPKQTEIEEFHVVNSSLNKQFSL